MDTSVKENTKYEKNPDIQEMWKPMKRSNQPVMRIEEKEETKIKEQKIFSTNS